MSPWSCRASAMTESTMGKNWGRFRARSLLARVRPTPRMSRTKGSATHSGNRKGVSHTQSGFQLRV
jgi:hypothetical protein